MALTTVQELKDVLGVGDLYPEEYLQQAVDAACDLVSTYIDAEALLDEPPACREAALGLAVEIWNSRLAPGGQLQGADFTPSPYRLGRSLMGKFAGLLAPYQATGGLIG